VRCGERCSESERTIEVESGPPRRARPPQRRRRRARWLAHRELHVRASCWRAEAAAQPRHARTSSIPLTTSGDPSKSQSSMLCVLVLNTKSRLA
jgi:hypothetical protein